MSVPELIAATGYPVETHEATTADGYILQLHRMPGPGPPVLLMHGLLCSSHCWVTSGPSSLGFLLADRGYDVWLGNFRGTRYGRRHTRLSPDRDPEFWRFTLHELGVQDLPAMIGAVLAGSGRTSLSFIGHSMGTTAFLILASVLPALAAPVGRAVLLAPVVEPHNMRNLVARLSAPHRYYRWLCESLGLLEVLPSVPAWQHLLHAALRLFGPPGGRADRDTLARICHHAKASKTSIYAILHYAQNIANRGFAAYDWEDVEENRARYGSEAPPAYQLTEVATETALFWSPRDSLSSRGDMERLVAELPNLVACRKVGLGHLDYLWGPEGAEGGLYTDLLTLLPAPDSQ